MFQLPELRIGNFFGFQSFFSEKNKIRKVTKIRKNKVLIDGKWLKFNRLNLIQITEDILLNCGFTQFKWLKDSLVFECKSLKCKLDNNGLNFFNEELRNSEPVKYLHKLQNLYYEMTGEELEINSNVLKLANAEMPEINLFF